MNKLKKVKRILITTAIILIIPLFGEIFIDGWNWGPGGFVFAALYLIFAGLIYSFGISRIKNKVYRITAGILVALVLLAIWGMLATG